MLPKEEVQQKTIEAISLHLCVKEEEISSSSTLEELGCDSLDSVELCMNLERNFNTVIPDEEWEKVSTVESIVNLLVSKEV